MGQIHPPPVENSRNSAECIINADNVYVRSGAGDNYYPTMKLPKGTKVVVIGEKFDWLKIMPPEGSFSYVGKHFIDKKDGGVGIVNRDNVNVRAGSQLNAHQDDRAGAARTGAGSENPRRGRGVLQDRPAGRCGGVREEGPGRRAARDPAGGERERCAAGEAGADDDAGRAGCAEAGR